MKSFIAALRSLVLPFGATTGARIVLDGVNGRIEVYNSSNVRIGLLDSTGLTITGTNRFVRITATGDIVTTATPASGASATLTTSPGFGAVLFMTPENAVLGSGAIFVPATIFADSDETVTDARPWLQIGSPQVDQTPDLAKSRIFLYGQSLLSGVDDSKITIDGVTVTVTGVLVTNGAMQLGAGAAVPVMQAGTTASGSTASATFVSSLTTTGVHGVVFVAPPSGKVWIIVRCVGGNSTALAYSIVDFEVAQGNVIGSGGLIRAADEAQASVFQSISNAQQGEHVSDALITGLTPGAVLNAYLAYHTGGGGTASFNRRHITVIPQVA